MATIASKNPFDLLGDDGAESGQAHSSTSKTEKPSAKAAARTAGRTAPPQDGPARAGTTRTRGDGGVGGNEAAFRDRNAGADRNRGRDTEPRGDYRGRGRGGRGGGRGRGGRGGGAPSDDRHSKTGVSDHDKQVARGWGDATGDGEWADEQAGEAIAKTEITEDLTEDISSPAAAPAEPAEEEVKTKTLDDFLAEQAEKRLQVSTGTSVRKANEGASKKLPTGKEYTREEEGDFIAGSGGKKIRDRGKKEKNVLELDGDAMRQTDRQATERRGGRGGRGGSRGDSEGGRGRGGGGRGGRGDGEYRGRGGRGGEFRGRGDGGAPNRGGRGGPRGAGGNAPNVSDQSAFPTLGS